MMFIRNILLIIALVASLNAELKKSKTTPQGLYLTALEAYEKVKKSPDSTLFVDVRSQLELEFVGWTPMVDMNIPYWVKSLSSFNSKKKQYRFVPNSDFLLAISEALEDKDLDKSSTIILLCRSGNRSAYAATLMYKAGYKNVYTVIDGFEGDKNANKERLVNGWKNSKLPWSYKLDEDKAYIAF